MRRLAVARAPLPQLEEWMRQRRRFRRDFPQLVDPADQWQRARVSRRYPCQVDCQYQLGVATVVSSRGSHRGPCGAPEGSGDPPEPGAPQPRQFEVIFIDRRLIEHTVTMARAAGARVAETYCLDQVTRRVTSVPGGACLER